MKINTSKLNVIKYLLKRILLVGIGLIITYVFIIIFKDQIINFIAGNEFLGNLYSGVYSEYKTRSLIGLVLVAFFGAFFFLPIPIELAFVAYLIAGFNPFMLLLIVMVSIIPGHALDIKIGHKFAFNISKFKKNKRFSSNFELLRKYGYFVIVFFNIIPSPAPVISFLAGLMNFKIIKVMKLIIVSQIIKYLVIIITFILIKNII